MTKEELIQAVRGWSKDDAPTFRTIRAICNGKLSRRKISEEQQKKMQEGRGK